MKKKRMEGCNTVEEIEDHESGQEQTCTVEGMDRNMTRSSLLPPSEVMKLRRAAKNILHLVSLNPKGPVSGALPMSEVLRDLSRLCTLGWFRTEALLDGCT
ncbi:hypothetical protein M9H77_18466 [Catharanthus roseus]|uniref:Uncharacterized protein n=1 Tax=Catharanthus roseus TaxID=4058 RepID=A0ACC0B7K1_CATRO|nr:hypothetical protein M9H77_18466 [Catharanthus roseus]